MLNFAVYFVCTHWLYYVVGVLHLDPVGSADVATQPLVLKGYFWTKPYQGSISTKTREFSISDKDLQCGCSRCWGCFWTKSVCMRVFHKLPKNIENLQTDWRSCPWLVLFTFAFLVVHICFFSGYIKHIFGVDKPDCNIHENIIAKYLLIGNSCCIVRIWIQPAPKLIQIWISECQQNSEKNRSGLIPSALGPCKISLNCPKKMTQRTRCAAWVAGRHCDRDNRKF